RPALPQAARRVRLVGPQPAPPPTRPRLSPRLLRRPGRSEAMTGGDVSRVIAFLTGRLGVFRTWGSFGRVAAWVVVWVVVIGAVLGAVTPGAGREYVPDFVEGNRVVY